MISRNNQVFIYTFFMIILLAGCSPKIVILHDGSAPSDPAFITSNYDDQTKNMISTKFEGTKKIHNLVVWLIDGLNVNGKPEITDLAADRYSDRFGNFNVELNVGLHEFTVATGIKSLNKSITKVSFTAQAKHKYYLGQVFEMDEVLSSHRYKWRPVIVDMTTHAFVDPNADISPSPIMLSKEIAKNNLEKANKYLTDNRNDFDVLESKSGLQYKIIKSGNGETPKITDRVSVFYRGYLIGAENPFDVSPDESKPTVVSLSKVIKGWQEGLTKMKEGDTWRLYIPPHLAYGEKGAKTQVGPNMLLIYELTLVRIL